MKDEWGVTESKYVDAELSRYRPDQLSDREREGLKAIRETLKVTSSRLPGFCFKSYVKGNVVWVMMTKANHGTQETVSSAKAKLSLLDDAVRMERTAFRQRLEGFLRRNGFEI